jgi:hypothetical protein
MKMKNIISVLLLMVISQSVFATKFAIVNKTTKRIQTKPIFTGGPTDFVPVNPIQGTEFDSARYDTGLHHCKK